jgi:hypothetical protein
MTKFARTLVAALIAGSTLGSAASAAVIDLDTLAGWDVQDQFDVLGNFYNNTYTTATGKSVKVTDLFVWGDEYEYFINGVSQGTILSPQPPAAFDGDPDSAYNGGLFAHKALFVGAGDTLSFKAITLPDGYTDGTIAVSTNVPEPASWALMIAGFGLVGAAMRRRATAIA